jgi:REP element-mobilizing transposase RayT
MPQSLSAVYIHLVFSTKDRAPVIPDSITPDLYSYIGGIARNEKCVSLAMGGMPDHVHLLVSRQSQPFRLQVLYCSAYPGRRRVRPCPRLRNLRPLA